MSTSTPPCAANASRNARRCSASASAYPSAELVQQPRRALDVREQEGDRARREVSHAASASATASSSDGASTGPSDARDLRRDPVAVERPEPADAGSSSSTAAHRRTARSARRAARPRAASIASAKSDLSLVVHLEPETQDVARVALARRRTGRRRMRSSV